MHILNSDMFSTGYPVRYLFVVANRVIGLHLHYYVICVEFSDLESNMSWECPKEVKEVTNYKQCHAWGHNDKDSETDIASDTVQYTC